ncbi:hypothetical protein [Prosthecobacter sp.]|jgi:hypothetical protein|uniref:hypothetical protein n=1 Tax=Prosthecobacter sp. TaxID=1965333 RepID=UPI003783A4DB
MNLSVRAFIGLAVIMLGSTGAAQQEAATEAQKKEILRLIEDLALSEKKAPEGMVLPPDPPELIDNVSDAYRKRYEGCEAAYKKLSTFKKTAFPFLLEYLGDERQSIAFRNHSLSQSVGAACFWNIYYQLQDLPQNYSSYGWSREGRDGKQHPKPYWVGTPFDDAGRLTEWMKQNQQLSYPEMQIKCLEWLLEKEKTIGAADAASYFENILPLEIRILERKMETGAEVKEDLARLRTALGQKNEAIIPAALLPSKNSRDAKPAPEKNPPPKRAP